MAAFIRSQRGAEKLIYEGFSYTKSKDGAQNKRHWRCDLWNLRKGKCPATAITNSNNEVIVGINHHNHEPSPLKIETAQIKDKIKQAAIDSSCAPKSIVDEQLVGISEEAKAILPKMVNLRKIVGRRRYSTINQSSKEASFIKSSRNSEKLFYKGFVYTKCRDGAENRRFWRCEKRKKEKCRGSAVTDGNNQVIIKQSHNHESSIKEAKIKRENIKKEEIVENCQNLDEQVAGVSNQKRVSLPRSAKSSKPVVIQNNQIKKYQNKKQQIEIKQSFTTKMKISQQIWTKTTNSENFILADTGMEDSYRIIIFASQTDISRLSSCDVWICDGTFECCPQNFYLWVIHGRFLQSAVLPFVYAFIHENTKECFQRVLDLLLSKINEFNPGARPQTILIDFEKEEEKALRSAIPTAEILGCFYYFKQSIWRKIVQFGLITKYQDEAQEEFRNHLKMFVALTFVDIANIRNWFRQLAIGFMKIYSDGDPDTPFAEFIDFMDRTFIGKDFLPSRFPLNLWNNKYITLDHLPNATNSAEFWHRELDNIFKQNFSVPCNLIEALLDVQFKVNNIAINIESGESIQMFNREEHLRDNECLLNLLNGGGEGQWNPMQFLTACSNYINFDI